MGFCAAVLVDTGRPPEIKAFVAFRFASVFVLLAAELVVRLFPAEFFPAE